MAQLRRWIDAPDRERRYAAVECLSVCLSVRPSVRPLQAVIVSKRLQEEPSWFWHGGFLPPIPLIYF